MGEPDSVEPVTVTLAAGTVVTCSPALAAALGYASEQPAAATKRPASRPAKRSS